MVWFGSVPPIIVGPLVSRSWIYRIKIWCFESFTVWPLTSAVEIFFWWSAKWLQRYYSDIEWPNWFPWVCFGYPTRILIHEVRRLFSLKTLEQLTVNKKDLYVNHMYTPHYYHLSWTFVDSVSPAYLQPQDSSYSFLYTGSRRSLVSRTQAYFT